MKKTHFLSTAMLFTLSNFAWANVNNTEAATQAVQTTTVANVAATQASQTTTAVQNDNKTVVISPRTGISYSFNNPEKRPVILKSEELAAANVNTVKRITASNPALSETSQRNAQLALVPELAQVIQQPAAAQ